LPTLNHLKSELTQLDAERAALYKVVRSTNTEIKQISKKYDELESAKNTCDKILGFCKNDPDSHEIKLEVPPRETTR